MVGPVSVLGKVDLFITCRLSMYTMSFPPVSALSVYICVRFCSRCMNAPRSARVDEGFPLPRGIFPPVFSVCSLICIAHAAVRLFPDTLPSSAANNGFVFSCCLSIGSKWGGILKRCLLSSGVCTVVSAVE